MFSKLDNPIFQLTTLEKKNLAPKTFNYFYSSCSQIEKLLKARQKMSVRDVMYVNQKMEIRPETSKEVDLKDTQIYRIMNIAFWSLRLPFCYIKPLNKYTSKFYHMFEVFKILVLIAFSIWISVSTMAVVYNVFQGAISFKMRSQIRSSLRLA